jgi:hypothetical protein
MNKRKKPGPAERLFADRRGDIAYIETAVTVLVVMILLAFTLNIFSFLTLRQDLEYFCGQLVIAAAVEGCTNAGVPGRFDSLCGDLGLDPACLSCSFEGSEFKPGSSTRIQYGDLITVTLTYRTHLGGMGALDIPVTVGCSSSGLSEKYWKQ